MPVIRELLARELVMLLALACLGAGPASLLSGRFHAVERVALAPVLGMCLGTCVFTTTAYFFRAGETSWLLPVLGVASVAFAVVRSRHAVSGAVVRRDPLGWASVGLVIVVVSVPTISVMRSQHTVGPVSYVVGDAIGYVGETDSDQQRSLHDAIDAKPPYRNLSDHAASIYDQSYQNIDLTPLSANVDSFIGLGSTSTWQAFIIAFLVAGALGALAAVRWALGAGAGVARALGGGFAGVMFSGAFFLQLVFAESQAGLCGLSLLLPLAAIAADTVKEPGWGAMALLALPVSGLFAMYPLFVAPTAAAGALALLVLAARRWRAGPGWRQAVWGGVLRVVFLIGLAACFNLVSFSRDLRYWKVLATGGFTSNAFDFPLFDMQGTTVPSWLLQTRNLFDQVPFSALGFRTTLEEIALPLVLVVVMVVALLRRPALLWLVVVIAVAVALGEYEASRYTCAYCTDRSLLPVGPMLIGLLGTGIGLLWMSGRRLMKLAGLVVIAIWLVPAFTAQRDLRNRVTGTGTFVSASARAVLAKLPHDASVDLEGFDANPSSASPEDPLTYQMAEEVSHNHATMPGDVSDNYAIAYFGLSPLSPEYFNPDYHYVLTRLAGVATGRRTVARYYGVALQERVSPLDVTIDSGAVAPSEQLDPSGVAWVSSALPLHLIVAGRAPGPAYVGIEMTEAVPATVPKQSGVVWRTRRDRITVCARAAGTAPLRTANVSITFSPVSSTPETGAYVLPPVSVGVQLDALAVSAKRCPFGGLKSPGQATSATVTATGALAPSPG